MFTRIQNDLVAAMKAHDKQRLSVIKMVKAAIDKERIDKRATIDGVPYVRLGMLK